MTEQPLTVVCWLFHGHGITSGGTPVQRDYTAAHVHRLARLMQRWLTRPHRVLCITDQPGSIDRGLCDVLEQPQELATLPKAYRKLWVFSSGFAGQVGIGTPVFVSDLDVCIVGALDTLLEREEPLVVWHDPQASFTRYSSGNYLFRAGTHSALWGEFSMQAIPRMQAWLQTRYGKAVGSDMAWMNYMLGEEATFAPGIYRAKHVGATLPAAARIVHFSGQTKSWHAKAQQRYPWIQEYEPV